jgi:hypothetical protein
VDFDETDQLQIICSEFVKYLRKNGNTTKQCISKKAYDSVRREVLYNIVIEFGIPMRLVSLIKMCLSGTYSRVRVGNNSSEIFPIKNGLKQGDTLSPLLFNFSVEYAFRRVQLNQDGLKFNGTHHLSVYADDVNISGRSVHTIKKNTKTLLIGSSKEIVLEVNADKTKSMVTSGDQNKGRSHNIKTDNSSFARVEEFI